jgi:hypothetical protein
MQGLTRNGRLMISFVNGTDAVRQLSEIWSVERVIE